MSYWMRVVLIPAGVFVSVMFGGGASTGLEITSYITANGPVGGYVAIGIIACIYSIVIFLCYELARLYRVYDYQGFARVLLGSRAWILYEVAITLAMLGVVAYSTTGGATALADFFGVSRYLVTAAILVLVIFLLYQGRRLVELTMVATTLLLLGSAFLLAISALTQYGDVVSAQLANRVFDFSEMFANVWIYSVVVTAYTPILLYASRDLQTRSEVLLAAVASGIAIMLPPLAMHTAYLSNFPVILDQAIPNAWIAAKIMPGWFSVLFLLILNLVILQTAVGILQGIVERVDAWALSARGSVLGRRSHALLSASVLLLCLGLSVFGVQRLLGWMYDISYWLFLFVLIIPLCTVGVYKIRDAKHTAE